MFFGRLIAVASLAVMSAAPTTVSQTPSFGVDLHGQPVAQLAPNPTTTIVLFFLATDCPVSNRYFPEIQRLREEFAHQNVSFWEVYPNVTETAAGIRDHEKSFASTLPVLLDPAQRTTLLTGARMTPSAAILTADPGAHGALKTLYLGRIDNRFVEIGVERPRATQHDLEDAIKAALSHQPIAPPGGPAVGCGIVRQQ